MQQILKMVNHTNKSKSTMTTTYQYGNDDLEYVLCSRGRPFVTLVSPTNPTPSSTLIDHNLVRELGLKISDLQCKKFYFGGEQLRVLGTISTTVQCVLDGFVCGSFQFRANVIEHLQTKFGVHSIAGMKLTKLLHPEAVKNNGRYCTSSGAPSPSPKSLPPTPKKSSPARPSPTPSRTKPLMSLPPDPEVTLQSSSSNLFLLQWDAALADAGDQHDDQPVRSCEMGGQSIPHPVESIAADSLATEGCQPDPDPVKITLLTMTENSTADVWPGGVNNSSQPIPWCHPDAHLVPWMVDENLTPNILCVNGIPSHYARGNCVLCQAPIDPDATIDPNVSMCTKCYIKEEIKRRRKRK